MDKGDETRINRVYHLLYGRPRTAEELSIGRDFPKRAVGGQAWHEYSEILLGVNEINFVRLSSHTDLLWKIDMPIIITFDIQDAPPTDYHRLQSMFERLGWERLGGSAYRYPHTKDLKAVEDWFNHVIPALMILRS